MGFHKRLVSVSITVPEWLISLFWELWEFSGKCLLFLENITLRSAAGEFMGDDFESHMGYR